MQKLANLKYTLEDSTIIELLGIQNFTNQNSAILELVKNAYDARANLLLIEFTEDNKLIIKDDGDGMDLEDIKTHWMRIGGSEKGYKIIDNNNDERVQAGQKGIGRLAMARLGTSIKVLSQKEDRDYSSCWMTNWNETTMKKEIAQQNTGTEIIISNLRDNWTTKKIKALRDYLSKIYNATHMNIQMKYNKGDLETLEFYFQKPLLGINCVSQINLQYDSQTHQLIVQIKSDEFSEEAQKYNKEYNKKYNKEYNITKYETKLNIIDELYKKDNEISKEELTDFATNLGDFCAEFYFRLGSITEDDQVNFLYKYKKLENPYTSGVILYRNAFGISSYDTTKDWVGFGTRARKSPAAATHPTGSWRVRENQISGKVILDKEANKNLNELSNRQGFDEGEFYNIFIDILDIGIKSFESYRQQIIQNINKKNDQTVHSPISLVAKMTNIMNDMMYLSTPQREDIIKDVKNIDEEIDNTRKKYETKEKELRYDVAILQILATTGLRATSIAHEMENNRNNIKNNSIRIIDALKEYELWDIVNEEDKIKLPHSSIPRLLSKNQKMNDRIVVFIDTMLTKIEKRYFKIEKHNIHKSLELIKNLWERDYSWVKILLNIDKEISYMITQNTIAIIFDNLILNSIQQNIDNNSINIIIQAQLDENQLIFEYSDNGIGLHKKYRDTPRRILEVHETTRDDGHGIGMWMVNNVIISTGGQIDNIGGEKGFDISFSLGESNG